MLKLSVLMLAALVASSGALAQGRPDLVDQSLRGGAAQFVPGELLVQFKAGTSPQAQAAALAFVRGERKATVLSAARRADGKGDLQLLSLPPGLGVVDAFRSMSQLAEVDFAEPNWIYQHQLVPNDPSVTNGSLWGVYGTTTTPSNLYGSGALAVWNRYDDIATRCSRVFVGIIDEGYFFGHQDLTASAYQNPGEAGLIAGRDDDGNKLVDDVWGWDFANNDATVFDGTIDDHGSHVAGTIGATINNGTGVAGVCPGVRLMSAKFLGRSGGTTANAIRSVDYFTDLKTRPNSPVPITATNNSWGGGGFSQALQDAIGRADSAGILFVAAAGNSTINCETAGCYPSSYPNPNVIAVASITNTGDISSFSNYGVTKVDIGAPGSGINSTVPVSSKGGVVSGYVSYSGTSMATPHVTGAAALFKALNPSATSVEIKAAILNSAKPTASLSGKTATGGRLDVSGFLAAP